MGRLDVSLLRPFLLTDPSLFVNFQSDRALRNPAVRAGFSVEGPLADIWKEDEGWMEIALREAEKALEGNESPVGAVVVTEGQVVGRGYNRVETLKDPTAHAEILAIGAASEQLGSWRLPGCTLYVTLEPCTMCAGAIVLCRIDRVVFGAYDPKAGACGSVLDVFGVPAFNHHPEVRGGVLEHRCGELLKSFFAGLRRGREAENTE